MGDLRFSSSFPSSQDDKTLNIDPYKLVEALLGQKIEKPIAQGSNGLQADYDELRDVAPVQVLSSGKGKMQPDSPPKDIYVGAVNPYALVEALIGRKIDKHSMASAAILSNVLQTDYDELFDMKHQSVLFAGLKLDEKDRKAEKLSQKEIKILRERDLVTPDLSEVQRLDDLEHIGLKDMGKMRVKMARMQNGKMHLVLHAHSLGKTLSNRDLTMSINELVSEFRMNKDKWCPPNSTWRDMYDRMFQDLNKRLIGDLATFRVGEDRNLPHGFDDPTQGCSSNSWLIAALFSVFWSDPSCINRATRVHHDEHQTRKLEIKFHDKGGQNNSRTETVAVNYEIPINNSNNEPVYCRSSDGADIWPSLYEKAFAKWITGSSSEHPDMTRTHCGDPIKAMAQMNGQDPHYYMTDKHAACSILGLVRSNCVNFKTINPMAAWTYATGDMYRGSNIVANHAYSVLGYTIKGDKQYIVLRNPWGVTEPVGLNSYPELLQRMTPEQWHPAAMLDHGGLFALEAHAFKHCFAWIGIAN
ncbi:hypothetical protein FZEAL_5155 [Fusarium zealandicum]|uniref:Calpain catalytic domain-containing protein n=1 Tax=Fusarium zealandicum TaxID=1053134 RepID=A0A8H4UKS5_9HYPO|nr:hypothetical protein FZEAL_5155 [Fusarium zealandicum]